MRLINTNAALHDAADEGHVDVAKVLIQNGVDVNAVDEDEKAALHWAAENERVDLAKVLLENGADVNKRFIRTLKNTSPYCPRTSRPNTTFSPFAPQIKNKIRMILLFTFGATIDEATRKKVDTTDLLKRIDHMDKNYLRSYDENVFWVMLHSH